MRDVSSEYRKKYEVSGPVCFNVKGIESYADHRVTTISGARWIVRETFQEIEKLFDEATKEA